MQLPRAVVRAELAAFLAAAVATFAFWHSEAITAGAQPIVPQNSFAEHALGEDAASHDPQCATSRDVSIQRPEQQVRAVPQGSPSLVHGGEHTPVAQTIPGVHSES